MSEPKPATDSPVSPEPRDARSTPTAPLRVALVGAGSMGLNHARVIRELGELAQVVAVADPFEPSLERAREVWPEAATYSDLDALVAAENPDVVHVCTRPGDHEAVIRSALQAGASVYVEKPFVADSAEAEELLEIARERGLGVCAGHQILAESAAQELLDSLALIGRVVHIDSYFSFRPVRSGPDGRARLAADEQLHDILPHPVYLLLRVLGRADPEGEVRVEDIAVGPGGTVHARISKGATQGNLIVTLEGRPVENILRVVGSNGRVEADFIRGATRRLVGPGTSALDKIAGPISEGGAIRRSSFKAVAARLRRRTYPGLRELTEAFYLHLLDRGPAPMEPQEILDTVRVCEQVGDEVRRAAGSAPPAPSEPTGPTVFVTGGTGFLGKRLAGELVARGARVRVAARRVPPGWDRVPGVEYGVLDLASGADPTLLEDVDVIIHAAAETSGGWEAHQANSIDATEELMQAAGAAGVRRFIQVSSVAVLAAPRGAGFVDEESPLHVDSRSAGPYVWGKLESERAVRERPARGVEVRVFRPAALIDYDQLEAPGRLGRKIGNLLVWVGPRNEPIGVSDVGFAAEALAWAALNFDDAPNVLNLLPPEMSTRGDLVARLKVANPDLRAIRLPRLLVLPMSWGAVLLQKVLRPGKPAIHLSKVFAKQRYSNQLAKATFGKGARVDAG